MDTQTFYTTTSSISFTLLGLWWVVVQARESLWRNEGHRRMAYAVSLHFLLPGVMSVLSLVAPDATWLWRITFVVAGVIGFVGAVLFVRTLRMEHDAPRIVQVVQWVVLPLYAIIAIVAATPETINGLGLDIGALQVEGIILSILLFLGVQAAWVLLVEPPKHTDAA